MSRSELLRAATRACGLLALLAACSVQDPAPALLFSDVTASSGIDFAATSGHRPATQILEVKGGGLALIDADGDGDLDLFVPNGATLEDPEEGPGCRMFENRGDLRFADSTARSGLDLRRWGFGTAVGDVDGDGRDDLYVACYGRNTLWRNEGGGRFAEITERAGVGCEAWSTAAAFGDVDGDGDLDLYVANYLHFDVDRPPPPTRFLGVEVFGGPIGLEPRPDVLYENLGDGTFRDASRSSGIDAAEPSFGLGAAILDLDGDGHADVLVGNDSQANFFFAGRGDGTFEEVGVASGLGLDGRGAGQATMGIAIGDVVGNGLPDVFTTHFMSDVNTLHVNLGRRLFEDRTAAWGLAAPSSPYLGWATAFHDLDHDGDEDLLVFNGHVYPRKVTEPHGWRHDQEPLLFAREGDRFRRVGAAEGGAWLDEARCDRSAAFGDLDGDGDVDAVVGELGGPLRVLRNDGAPGAWLIVALEDARPDSGNHRGLGSRVVLRAGDTQQVRWIFGGGSYQASCAQEAHFGLGDAAGPLEVEVTWPDGERQLVTDVEARRRLLVRREERP